MKKYNVLSHETIFVGDAKTDILMGQNAGVTPIVVLTGHLSKKEAEKLQVKWIIPDVTYLPKILEEL